MPIYQVKTNIPVIIINSYIFILLDTTWHTSVFVSTLFLQILQASYFLFRCSFHNPATRFFMIGIPTCIVQFSLFLWFDEHKKLTWLIWILGSCEFYIYIFHNWIFFFFTGGVGWLLTWLLAHDGFIFSSCFSPLCEKCHGRAIYILIIADRKIVSNGKLKS